MAVRVLLLLLGLFHLVNGLWMLAAPDAWYAAIPGVRETGPLNHHFIADVALAYIASGFGLVLGSTARRSAAAFAAAGAAWPVLHAGLHIWNWLMHGFPATAPLALSEGLGVVGVSALVAVLAWLRQQGDS
jgi:hypothetical protein